MASSSVQNAEQAPKQQEIMPAWDDFVIRSLTRADLEDSRIFDQLLRLHKDELVAVKPCCCCIYEGDSEVRSNMTKGFARASDEKLEDFAIALNADGEVLGYNMLGFHDTMGDPFMPSCLRSVPRAGTCHIEQIAVGTKHHGKGVGKKLMIWAEKKAQERGCNKTMLEVLCNNGKAKAFYEKGGMKSKNSCCEQCLCCPVLCCMMSVPYVHTMEKQLEVPKA